MSKKRTLPFSCVTKLAAQIERNENTINEINDAFEHYPDVQRLWMIDNQRTLRALLKEVQS